mmetsp:Transcript_29517/g.61948  ORF Transcript_29517/g.61948 Transcript_29517/m.61948 type:complete len:112 (-) Transcript_29517:726-1061(-)
MGSCASLSAATLVSSMVVSGVTLARAKRKTRQSSIYTQQNTECDDRQRNHIDSQRSDQGKSEKQPYIDWTVRYIYGLGMADPFLTLFKSFRDFFWLIWHYSSCILLCYSDA